MRLVVCVHHTTHIRYCHYYSGCSNNCVTSGEGGTTGLDLGFLLTMYMHPQIITLLTYLLTPWCRVLLEQLTGLQLVNKFSAFHGTRNFITTLTSICQLSLSWASPIQSIYPHPTSWRSILILSIQLRLGLRSGLFPSCFPGNFSSIWYRITKIPND